MCCLNISSTLPLQKITDGIFCSKTGIDKHGMDGKKGCILDRLLVPYISIFYYVML